MARPLDPHQRRELAAFVNDLFASSGFASLADWARESGYHPPNLYNLHNAVKGVDGYNLFKLIRAAAQKRGVRPDELALERAKATSDDSLASLGPHLAELARAVGELERVQAAIADSLGVPRGDNALPAAEPSRQQERPKDRRQRKA